MTLLNKKYCLLLTATVAPQNVPNLKRSNVHLREGDYINSLTRWLTMDIPVVFVENSFYDSARIAALLADRPNCEYLRLDSAVSYLGKSHGEAEIMAYAFANSQLIRESDVIVKITGRLFIKNAPVLLRAFDALPDVTIMGWLKENLSFADSRFFICSKPFYQKFLLPELHLVDEAQKMYIEHVTARAVHLCLAEGYQWRMFSQMPVYEGYSGTADFKYKNDFLRFLKRNTLVRMANYLLKMG